MGETLHNPGSAHYKCGLIYKACGPYLSKMPLIPGSWSQERKCMVLHVAHISQCFIQWEKTICIKLVK